MKLDPQDNLIHLRTHPDNAIAKPAECGKTGQRTINDAAGYYGPEGLGWKDVCMTCVRVRRERLEGVRKLRGW